MNTMVLRICGVILFGAPLFLVLTGCAPQEDLVVPPASAMLGKILVRQTYVLQRPTVMEAMDTGNGQPQIHLDYDKSKDGPPPAEAFERVPFPVSASRTDLETDPNDPTGPEILVTTTVPAQWGSVKLDAGTQISVTSAKVYNNSRVYRGQILNGFAHDCYILLVVPVGDSKVPTIGEMQNQDQGYLTPLNPVSVPPVPTPGATP